MIAFDIKKGDRKLNKKRFTKLLEQMISDHLSCVHDFKMLFLLIESFGDAEYLACTINHLDKFYPKLLGYIVENLFMMKFQKKFEKVLNHIYKRIYNSKFYALENFPMMHHLDSNHVLFLNKNFTLRVYNRPRYVFMAAKGNKDLFLKYISK